MEAKAVKREKTKVIPITEPNQMGITVMEATRRTAIIPIPGIINTIKSTTVQMPASQATVAVAAADGYSYTHFDGAARPMTRTGTTIHLKRIKPSKPTGVPIT